MSDFLLELLTEEIPARMQARAAEQLATRFADGIKGQLAVGTVETFVTPRRLILIARGLAAQGDATSEERRGPRADAPAQAIDGFLRATGLPRDQLEERDTPKGRFLYATIRAEGRPAAAVLAELIPAIVRDFDWPKSMRWGAASVSTASPRWVRPLSGIVALLGDAVVAFEAAGIVSGRMTMGHRFMSAGPIEIASAATYPDQLRAAKVITDPAERARVIADGAQAAAAAHGLTLIDDAGLVAENAGLTEWPVPLLGAFDPAFLDVPREVIQLTMRTNQKYFACTDAEGRLAPVFVCVANLEASDGGAGIVSGNRKVLAARLADAKFFWDQDRAVTLESRLPKLGQIVFHEKLGTVADKVERVAKLARWLVESGAIDPPRACGEGDRAASGVVEGRSDEAPSPAAPPLHHRKSDGPPPHKSGEDRERLADLAETAARLCKADLVSATVGEFPEVQGIAGGHLALAEGLDPQIAAAIRDHYKPVGPSDDVPTAPVTVAVALADKLDTLASFLAADEAPTGSRDPFALRRSALGALRIVLACSLRLSFRELLQFQLRTGHVDGAPNFGEAAYERNVEKASLRSVAAEFQNLINPEDWPPANAEHLFGEHRSFDVDEVANAVLAFLADRLKVQQREAGVRPDIIDAVFALGGEDDLVRLLARVHALQAFLATPDGTNLLAGYRRAANILRIEEAKDGPFDAVVDHGHEVPAEVELRAATARVAHDAAAAVAAEDFAGAMTAFASLRPAVDAFFGAVMVNDPVPEVRRSRLALLNRLREAVHTVADFSKIEG